VNERHEDAGGCCCGCIVVVGILVLAFIGALHVAAGFM
jgi:hypothetical protein